MRNERSINLLASGKEVSLEDYLMSLCKMLEAVEALAEVEIPTTTEAA